MQTWRQEDEGTAFGRRAQASFPQALFSAGRVGVLSAELASDPTRWPLHGTEHGVLRHTYQTMITTRGRTLTQRKAPCCCARRVATSLRSGDIHAPLPSMLHPQAAATCFRTVRHSSATSQEAVTAPGVPHVMPCLDAAPLLVTGHWGQTKPRLHEADVTNSSLEEAHTHTFCL